MNWRKAMKILKSSLLVAILLIGVSMATPAYAGTPHTSWGNVLGGEADATCTFKFYVVARPGETLTGNLVGPAPFVWFCNVGNLPSPWSDGEDSMAEIDKELNSGTASHAGYYAVMNEDLDASISPQQYNDCTLRAIPVPTGVAGDSQISLSWSAATEDASATPHGSNVSGYDVYRSSNQATGFAKMNSSTITGTSWVDNSTNNPSNPPVNGTTYYYALGLVYRGGVASDYYSANSDPCTPGAGPALTNANPSSAYQGDILSTVDITGVNTNFQNGVSVADFGTGITVGSTTVSSATQCTANTVTISVSASTGLRSVTVTTGGEVASGNIFTVNAPSIGNPNPPSGAPGDVLTGVSITGTGTHFNAGTTSVDFGDANITIDLVNITSATQLTCRVTINLSTTPGSKTVTVTTTGLPGGSEIVTSNFTVTSPGPVIDHFEVTATSTPTTEGKVYDGISIIGSDFGSDPGAGNRGTDTNNITFYNGVRVPDGSVYYWSDTKIDIAVPQGALDGDVRVTAGGIQSNGKAFNVLPPDPVTNLVADPLANKVTLSWTNPGDAGLTGVLVIKREDGAPTAEPADGTDYSVGETLGDGTVVYNDLAATFEDTNVEAEKTYYYDVYAHDGGPNYSSKVQTSATIPSDSTPPDITNGVVNDGLSADIDIQTETDELSANWSGFEDPESDISEYQYKITDEDGNTFPGCDWASVGTDTSVTKTGLSLTLGEKYYVFVKATNGVGLESDIVTSDGVSILEPEGKAPNYPNPFDPRRESTKIIYYLPRDMNTAVYIFDITARIQRQWSFVAGEEGGKKGWNEVEWDGRNAWNEIIGSGVYLVKVVGNDRLQATGKILVVKRP